MIKKTGSISVVVLLIGIISSPLNVIAEVSTDDNSTEMSSTSLPEESTTVESTSESTTETTNTTSSDTNSTTSESSVSEESVNGNGSTEQTTIDSSSENTIGTRTKRANSEPENGMTYTPSPNTEYDPFKGGTLAINRKVSVSGNKVVWYTLFHYNVKFSFSWTPPKRVSPQQFIDALNMSNTQVWMGDHNLAISKENFKANKNGTVVFTASNSNFDLFAIIKYLWNLVFGGGTADIWSYIHLDVNKLSKYYVADHSKGYVVTDGKLTPDVEGVIKSKVNFFDSNDNQVSTQMFSIPTWSSYISPWNKEQSSGEKNGKVDDTQSDGSLEVVGVPRVIKGNNYKSRNVELPISQNIEPLSYVRVVNMFSKQIVENLPVKNDAPIIKEQHTEKGDTAYLNKTTTIFYRDASDNVAISPVPISFTQKTYLKLKVNSIDRYPKNKKIPIKGIVDSEGSKYNYYYKIDNGTEVRFDNKSLDTKQIDGYIPGLSEGTHSITIKVTNELNISKEATFDVTISGGALYLNSVPTYINFGTTKMSPNLLRLKGNPTEELIVSDTRDTSQKTNWQLLLKEKIPLINKNGVKMNYKNRDKQLININENNQPIEHNLADHPEEEKISDDWKKPERGLFLDIPLEAQKIGVYSGSLTWTLQDTPQAN